MTSLEQLRKKREALLARDRELAEVERDIAEREKANAERAQQERQAQMEQERQEAVARAKADHNAAIEQVIAFTETLEKALVSLAQTGRVMQRLGSGYGGLRGRADLARASRRVLESWRAEQAAPSMRERLHKEAEIKVAGLKRDLAQMLQAQDDPYRATRVKLVQEALAQAEHDLAGLE